MPPAAFLRAVSLALLPIYPANEILRRQICCEISGFVLNCLLIRYVV